MTDNITQAPDEREAIVRWLRERADVFYDTVRSAYPPHIITKELAGDTASRWGELQAVADAIERGDHLSDQRKDWREVEAEVRQHWKWGNLTRLGVVNMLARGGWRMEAAIEKSNDICGPVVPSLAAQDGLVEALEEIGRLAETLCEYDGEVCNIAEYILSAHRSALSAIKGDKS